MLVVGVAVALALASSATRGLDPDLRAQDISTPRPLILAHVVSGSEGGQADGMCVYQNGNRNEQGRKCMEFISLVCLVGT